jgi:hypothetical protein
MKSTRTKARQAEKPLSQVQKSVPAGTPVASRPQREDIVGRFSLSFLDDDRAMLLDYGSELLTAEEKTAYYEDRLKNEGREDVIKIAKNCRERAAELRKQASQLDAEEAKPLLWKANGFESGAIYLENITEAECAEGDIRLEGGETCYRMPDGEAVVDEHGLPNLQCDVAEAVC